MSEKCRFYVDLIAQHSEVTGSCFLLVIKIPGEKQAIKGIVDCGLFQERKYEELNQTFSFNANEVKFVLLTHAHMDHIGRVPKLVKEGFEGYIFCTKDTAKLMPEAFENGYKVFKKNAKLRHQPNLVLYDEKDILEAVDRTCPLEYMEEMQIHENVKVTFIPNGHLIGAAMILIDIYDYDGNHINLLFTGDYNNDNVFLNNHEIPKEILDKNINIITESTYSATTTVEQPKVFEENVAEAVQQKKVVIIPAFALGRSQEVLYQLKKMQDNGKISENTPIYLDGNLAMTYTSLYEKGELNIKHSMLKFEPKNLNFVTSDVLRNKLVNDDECKIIVTTSGMGKHGPARMYIPNVIEKKNALIHFTGYCTEGTFGRILKDTPEADEIMLGGLLLKRNAQIEFTSEFSSHARSNEVIDLIKKFRKIESVIVNHGSIANKIACAKSIHKEVQTKKVGIIDSTVVFRVGKYGVIKTITPYDK